MAIKKDAAFYRKQRLDDEKKAKGGDKKAKAELGRIESKRVAARGKSTSKPSAKSDRSAAYPLGSGGVVGAVAKKLGSKDYTEENVAAGIKRSMGGAKNILKPSASDTAKRQSMRDKGMKNYKSQQSVASKVGDFFAGGGVTGAQARAAASKKKASS